MTQLSKNLSLQEVTNSDTAKRLGISNIPTEAHLKNLVLVAENVFQKIRDHFGKPINVSSGYRSAALNEATPGSSATSQHSKGEALDLDMDSLNNGVTNRMIFEYIKDNLKFDQLIAEYPENGNPSWVHVSYSSSGKQRNQILVCKRKNGSPSYSPFTNLNDLK